MADANKWDGLDDFEKSLAAEKSQRERDEERRERKHRHRSHREKDGHHERRHRNQDAKDDSERHGHRRHRDDDGDEHRHKRSRRDDNDSRPRTRPRHRDERHSHKSRDAKEDLPLPDDEKTPANTSKPVERDSWMTAPSALEIDYIQRKREKTPSEPVKEEREVHRLELNKHLNDEEYMNAKIAPGPKERIIDYTFGDSGSSWRMKKLRAVFSTAENGEKSIEEIATKQYGNLEYFDDAREEKEEMERRSVYGTGYEMKEKPTGELYQERLRNIRKGEVREIEEPEQGTVIPDETPVALDQTALNRLRAQMMKAKLKRAPHAAQLEEEYNQAAAAFVSNRPPNSVVVGAMESRQLAGTRAEVKAVDTKRGRERGTVVENENMTIEDMVREERRTKGQAGGEALRQAERIAKDVKYTDDLDYMDDNAAKLAKRVHKNEASLKNMAVGELQRLNRVLDNCPLCHHEDSGRPPIAPVISLAIRTFLTLPTDPEVSTGGAVIAPITHRKNLLECDDDEWEELRNFMKSLTRMYHAQGRDVLFYENAAAPQQHRHAALVAVPIPYSEGAMAPQYFKEAFLSSDAEWSQHRPIIDTQKAAENGLGRVAFRRSIAKEMPYFHVWFTLDGGLGHVVEDGRWPKGDLFAREVVGGIVGAEMHIIKKQGRWTRGIDPRVEGWKKEWRKYDWTRVLEEV